MGSEMCIRDRGISADPHQYDLPVHFKGQLIETSFDMAHSTELLTPMGEKNGYQHLWKRSASEALDGLQEASWLLSDQFYTMSFKADLDPTAYFVELGANDPNHNLRHEQGLILRAEGNSVTYVSVYERHGRYDSDEEVTVFDGSSINDINIDTQNGITEVTVETDAGDGISFRLAQSALTRAPLQVARISSETTKQIHPTEGGK